MQRWFLTFGIVALVGVMSAGTWLVLARRSDEGAGKKELRQTVGKVQKLIELPTDEEPTLATVTDQSRLTDPFLAKAANGDKILIYYQAKKAYIYRPSTNKIIDVGPVLVDPALSEIKDSRIVIRNGSRRDALTKTVEEKVKATYPEVSILETGPATKSDFPTTIVIDLTEEEKKYNFVGSLAQVIGGQRGVLPAGEPKPGADILILIGNDQ